MQALENRGLIVGLIVTGLLIAIIFGISLVAAQSSGLPDDTIWQGSANDIAVPELIPDCDTTSSHKMQYDQATNAWSCDSTAPGSAVTVEEDDADPQAATSIDYGAGLDRAFAGGEADITVDILEVALTDDSIWTGDAGGNPAEEALTDCDDSAGNLFTYDTATNAFGCGDLQDNTLAVTGEWDFGGGGIEIENNTALPGACTVGQIFLDTDATSGQQLFGCEGGSFVLQGDGSGGGSGSVTTVEEDDSQVGGADIVTLDFQSGFDIAESPDTEINISLDLSEVVTGDVTYTGNVAEVTEADALETNPTDCGANTFADAIAANGDLTCNGVVDADVSDTLTVGNAGTVDPDALSCDVGDDNLISEDCIGDVLDASEIEDLYVFIAGDAIAGDLDFNDGVADSPKATFTPATGTAWDIFAEDTGDDLQIEVNTASEEALDIVNVGAGTVRLTLDGGLTLSGFDCTGNANGGALTANASGVVSCSDDDGGGGSGDVLTVNSTAVDTTGNFLDGDIDFTHVDGGPGGPDDITATVACSGCVDVTDIGANAVDGSELVDDSVDTTELDDTEAPAVGQLVATDNATATRLEYIAVGTGLTHDGDTLTADLGTAIDAGEITAAAIDGDDVNANIAGRSLTLTAASPDTLDIDVEIWTDTKGLWFEDPTAADDFKSIWIVRGFAATITKIWCESDQTVTMMLQVDDGTPADVDSVDLICITTPDTDDALNGDATMADGDRLDLVVTSVSGTPTFVSIMWTFTKDD